MRNRVVALLVLLVIGGSLPARAGLTSISGRVTGEDGAPLEGMCVWAFPDRLGSQIAMAYTGRTGSYLIDVSPGIYHVQFGDCARGEYRAEWFDDAEDFSDARQIVALVGQTKKINAALARLGSVSGTVRLPGGSPLNEACVFADGLNGDYGFGVSDDEGHYVVGGLEADLYSLRFEDCYREDSPLAPEWYDDVRSPDLATLVEVEDRIDTPGIDATLDVGATIAGEVRDVDGNDLEEICVYAYRDDGGDTTSIRSAADGSYELRGLLGGSYRVEFTDCWRDEFRLQYFDRAETWEDATLVDVAFAQTTGGIDAYLEPV